MTKMRLKHEDYKSAQGDFSIQHHYPRKGVVLQEGAEVAGKLPHAASTIGVPALF